MAKKITEYTCLFLLALLVEFTVISKAVILHNTSVDGMNITEIFQQDSLLQQTRATSVLSKTPKDSTFTEGDLANLGCLTTNSNTQLSWEKNGEPVYETNRIRIMKCGFIFFENVKLEDMGNYACVARDLRTGCTEKSYAVLKINPRDNVEEICGKVKAKEAEKKIDPARIVSGHRAHKGSHPWQVLVKVFPDVYCGGVLLNHRWIATAAHCFYSPEKRRHFRWSQMEVMLGENDRFVVEEEELLTYITHISSVVIHPNFNIHTLHHDIALVRLKNMVHFTEYILPICLGGTEFGDYIFKSGVTNTNNVTLGIVTGWGNLNENGIKSRFLQEVSLPIVDQNTCKESSKHYIEITESMFCAGYPESGSQDACNGDSGSPFAVQHDGRWYLIGLVSGGIGCARENHYGFYTNIPAYTEWIKVIIASE